MIKTVDLIWKNDDIPNYLTSQQFSFGWFEIYSDDGAYFIYNTKSDDYYWEYLAFFKDRKSIISDDEIHIPIIETIEEAKQACQDYLLQIAKEIIK